MKTFKDSQGREWSPVLNALTLVRFGRSTGIFLGEIASLKITIDQLVDMIWAFCEDQAKGRDVSRDDFLASLDIDAIQGAFTSIMEEVQRVFPEATEAASQTGPFAPGALKTS